MIFRVFFAFAFFIFAVSPLAVLKWDKYPCNYTAPTIYDSALLVEGESLHLSCSICNYCEPTLAECKSSFDITQWIREAQTKLSIKKRGKIKKRQVTTLRER